MLFLEYAEPSNKMAPLERKHPAHDISLPNEELFEPHQDALPPAPADESPTPASTGIPLLGIYL